MATCDLTQSNGRRVVEVCVLALLLQGCGPGFHGATPTLDVGGPTSLGKKYLLASISPGKGEVSPHPGPVGMFELSWSLAAADQMKISSGLLAPSDYSEHAKQAALDGVALADAYCSEFFDSGGTDQKWFDFAKDLATETGTLATGVLALASPSNAAATGGVALATATAISSEDVYSRNFLFGSDNIDTVRDMTFKALDADRAQSFPPDDHLAWTLRDTEKIVRTHQEICTPASIKKLVLASIGGSNIEPAANTSNAVGETASAQSVATATNAAASDAVVTAQAAQAAPTTTAVTSALNVAASAGASAAALAAAGSATLPMATTASIQQSAQSAAQAAAQQSLSTSAAVKGTGLNLNKAASDIAAVLARAAAKIATPLAASPQPTSPSARQQPIGVVSQ